MIFQLWIYYTYSKHTRFDFTSDRLELLPITVTIFCCAPSNRCDVDREHNHTTYIVIAHNSVCWDWKAVRALQHTYTVAMQSGGKRQFVYVWGFFLAMRWNSNNNCNIDCMLGRWIFFSNMRILFAIHIFLSLSILVRFRFESKPNLIETLFPLDGVALSKHSHSKETH